MSEASHVSQVNRVDHVLQASPVSRVSAALRIPGVGRKLIAIGRNAKDPRSIGLDRSVRDRAFSRVLSAIAHQDRPDLPNVPLRSVRPEKIRISNRADANHRALLSGRLSLVQQRRGHAGARA